MIKKSLILSIFALLLLIVFYSISAESQVQAGDLTFYPANESLIQHDIVIIIDSSGSTAATDPTTGVSVIGSIDANAVNIIRDLGRCSDAGVVAFGGNIVTTGMLSMSNDTNKARLETVIRAIGPNGANNPTDVDNGLRSAQRLLNSSNGTKEIIVLSDGLMPPEGFDRIINTIIELKNERIKIQFIQILVSYGPNKEPNIVYDKMAHAADGQVIVLNPDERIITPHPAIESNEPCIEPTQSIAQNATPTEVPAPDLTAYWWRPNETATLPTEKQPGFEGIFTILVLLILVKLKP